MYFLYVRMILIPACGQGYTNNAASKQSIYDHDHLFDLQVLPLIGSHIVILRLTS